MSILFSPTLSTTSTDIYYPISTIKTIPLVQPITTITTPIVQVSPYYKLQIDTGLNDNWLIQKQANEWLWYRILDYWIHESEMRGVLKYMVIENGKVRLVKSMEEYEKNDISNDKLQDRELKSDFIEENYLSKDRMRKILIKVIEELGYKWQFLTQAREEKIIVGVTKRYLKKQFQKAMGL
jgi:hypothetical protein